MTMTTCINKMYFFQLLALYKTLLHPEILDSKEIQRYFLDYTRLLPKDDSITIKDTVVEAVRLKDVFGANELTLNFLAKLFLSQIDGNKCMFIFSCSHHMLLSM